MYKGLVHCPIAGVFTTHETHCSWIIYKEAKTEKGNTSFVQAGRTIPIGSEKSDPDLDNMHMFLDKELRPATPDLNDPRSVEIYEEHKLTAQEYLKVETQLVYQSQEYNRLRAKQSVEKQNQRKNIQDLQIEKEALVLLKEHLIQQKEAMSQRSSNRDDVWQVLSRHQDDEL